MHTSFTRASASIAVRFSGCFKCAHNKAFKQIRNARHFRFALNLVFTAHVLDLVEHTSTYSDDENSKKKY